MTRHLSDWEEFFKGLATYQPKVVYVKHKRFGSGWNFWYKTPDGNADMIRVSCYRCANQYEKKIKDMKIQVIEVSWLD